MKLSDLAKQVMNEDTWGNNPSAAGGMSPGKTPNAVSPAPSAATKDYDVGKEFANFENIITREEEAASKNLETTISTNLANKKVKARASKGSVGQTEQDYTIDVLSVDVTYMSDKFYIILKGADKKDYYINPGFKIKVLGKAEQKGSAPSTPEAKPTAPAPGGMLGGKKQLGMAYPQNMGIGSNKNVG